MSKKCIRIRIQKDPHRIYDEDYRCIPYYEQVIIIIKYRGYIPTLAIYTQEQ